MANIFDFPEESEEQEAQLVLFAEATINTETEEEQHKSSNIAEGMDEKELQKIAKDVCEAYEEDLNSRSSWMEKVAKWRKIYFQEDKPAAPPWQGASEESIPIMTEAVNQFRSRATRVMFPSSQVVAALPTAHVTEEDMERADRISKHMSWQITVQDKSYKKNKKRLAGLTALDGSFFTKIYRDPVKKVNVVKNVPARFLVVPYGDGPRDLEDLNRKTEIVHISTNETRKMADRGYLLEAAETWRKDDIEDEVKEAIDEAVGLDQPTNTDISGMSVLMEWHGFLDLDDDGIEEPYIVVIDAETKKILRIAERWEEGDEEKTPLEFYEHYYFLENPDGFYGLGFGFILEQLNSAINRMLRQSINASTLQNTAGGFIDEALGVQKGEVRFSMGQFKKVSANGQDLRQGILAMNQYFPGADQGIVTLMEMMVEHAKRLAMTTDALSGQVTKVMQPTTILALIEQGLQQFTAAQENILDAWTGELRKLYYLNSLYLDDEEYFAVQDETGDMKQQKVMLQDYELDLQVLPVADPSMATQQQKIAKAQALIQGLMAGLQLGIPYNKRQMIEHLKRYYEAYEFPHINQLLPVAEEPMMREDDPMREQFYALLPGAKMPAVHYDQDHAKHFMEHFKFMNDQEYGTRIPPEMRHQLEMHNRTHVAMLYAKDEVGMGPDEIPNEYVENAQAETLVPPQQDMQALQQIAGQGGEEAFGPGPTDQASQSQEELGAILGG